MLLLHKAESAKAGNLPNWQIAEPSLPLRHAIVNPAVAQGAHCRSCTTQQRPQLLDMEVIARRYATSRGLQAAGHVQRDFFA
jgi:hypothetical protein